MKPFTKVKKLSAIAKKRNQKKLNKEKNESENEIETEKVDSNTEFGKLEQQQPERATTSGLATQAKEQATTEAATNTTELKEKKKTEKTTEMAGQN